VFNPADLAEARMLFARLQSQLTLLSSQIDGYTLALEDAVVSLTDAQDHLTAAINEEERFHEDLRA